jgi:hypothetical protein
VPLDQLLQYGVLGLVVVGFLTGQIQPKSRVDREVELTDRATAVNDKLVTALDRQTAALDAYRRVVETKA